MKRGMKAGPVAVWRKHRLLACGAIAVLAAVHPQVDAADGSRVTGDVSLGHDDNLNNGAEDRPQLDDVAVEASLVGSALWRPGPATTLALQSRMDTQQYTNYERLSSVRAGLGGRFSWRSGNSFDSPTLSLATRLMARNSVSSLRDGVEWDGRAAIEQALTTRITLGATLSGAQRWTRDEVFDIGSRSGEVSVDWQPASRLGFFAAWEYRSGDMVVTGKPNQSTLDRAKAYARDDAFEPDLEDAYAYRIDADARIGKLGGQFQFTRYLALDLQWTGVSAKNDSGVRYRREQLFGGLLFRF